MRSKFDIVGVTPEGVNVMSGVFSLFDTYGLPLDSILDMMKDKNMIPCWTTFYNDATTNGWKHKSVMTRLVPLIGDVYGPEFSTEVGRRLDLLDTAVETGRDYRYRSQISI